ncbi:hypothetical protein ACNFJ7_12475 [Sphingomonas sp. HT-1]|uniref:hypothetical protein n=1 Tax=unclassified Sphingomonas TaxID=196159 RepID=UPI0002EC7D45|nr:MULTISPECIES: hypothetical protein [unclassified Sphingomonas]KTF68214.1 hypothetical protein ATB93_01800 [Sphingomonas sp. WG]
MTFLKYISPLRALRDLRGYLASRKRHELWFMLLALVVTFVVIVAFVKDSHIPVPYRKNIIYVESWPITRTQAEIRAQQKVDEAKRLADEAALAERRKKRQAEFKKYDDWLEKHGI